MSDKKESGDAWGASGGRHGYMSIVIVSAGGSGTAQVNKLGGNNPDTDTWVPVTSMSYTGDSEDTFYAPQGQLYQVVLGGDAVAWVAG